MQTDKFKVSTKWDGQQQTIDVNIDSSTDDADTYVCHLNGERITQIRKDSGQWKQLWGELNDQQVNQLGEAIDRELTK